MNNKFFIYLGLALFLGYLLGNSGSNDKKTIYTPSSYPPRYSDSDNSYELRQRLENAKNDLDRAVSAAEDAEDAARFRWIQTGRIEDMMRMHNAEDAADAARQTRNNLD